MEKQEYIAIPIKTWQELSAYLGMQPFASARPIVQILESTCLPPHMVTVNVPDSLESAPLVEQEETKG